MVVLDPCFQNWSPSQFTCVVREIFEMRVQVMNELPYLVEWITYYHIQGTPFKIAVSGCSWHCALSWRLNACHHIKSIAGH